MKKKKKKKKKETYKITSHERKRDW